MSLGGKTVLTLARALKGIESQRRLEGNELAALLREFINKGGTKKAAEEVKEKATRISQLLENQPPGEPLSNMRRRLELSQRKTPGVGLPLAKAEKKASSAKGMGLQEVSTKGLSKKEIKELIDLGFPLRLPTPKGAKLIAREFEQTGRLKKKFKFTDEQKQALAEAKKASQRTASPVKVPPIGEAFENLVRPRKAVKRFRGGEGRVEAEMLDYQARVLHFADKEARQEVLKELKTRMNRARAVSY